MPTGSEPRGYSRRRSFFEEALEQVREGVAQLGVGFQRKRAAGALVFADAKRSHQCHVTPALGCDNNPIPTPAKIELDGAEVFFIGADLSQRNPKVRRTRLCRGPVKTLQGPLGAISQVFHAVPRPFQPVSMLSLSRAECLAQRLESIAEVWIRCLGAAGHSRRILEMARAQRAGRRPSVRTTLEGFLGGGEQYAADELGEKCVAGAVERVPR